MTDVSEVKTTISNRRVTSTVYTEPSTWWQCGFLYPHEAIRRLFEQANRIVPKFDPVQKPWQAALFQQWFNDLFFRFIETHHEMEETIYFPQVAARITLSDRVTADHKTLIKYLHEVKDFAALLVDTSSGAEAKASAVEKIKELLVTIVNEMTPHLDEEERDISPLVGQNFTEKEELAIVAQIIAAERKAGNGEFSLSLVYDAGLEWMTPAQMSDFMSTLPPPVRLLLKKFWYPAFCKKEKMWALQLCADTAPVATADSGCSCSIM